MVPDEHHLTVLQRAGFQLTVHPGSDRLEALHLPRSDLREALGPQHRKLTREVLEDEWQFLRILDRRGFQCERLPAGIVDMKVYVGLKAVQMRP